MIFLLRIIWCIACVCCHAQVEVKTFHMQVDIDKFEKKLRNAEASLGIKPGHGVPVVYERGEDAMAKFLSSLIVAGILLSLLSRNKGIKASGFTDAIVSIQVSRDHDVLKLSL